MTSRLGGTVSERRDSASTRRLVEADVAVEFFHFVAFVISGEFVHERIDFA